MHTSFTARVADQQPPYCKTVPDSSDVQVLLTPCTPVLSWFRLHGVSAKTAPVDQFVCRAHFARGQLVAKLSSSCKGQQLVDAVLEAVDSIMRGVDIAAANPRYVKVGLHTCAYSSGSCIVACCRCCLGGLIFKLQRVFSKRFKQ